MIAKAFRSNGPVAPPPVFAKATTDRSGGEVGGPGRIRPTIWNGYSLSCALCLAVFGEAGNAETHIRSAPFASWRFNIITGP